MGKRIAYLADGKLFIKEGELAPRLVESAFAQGVLDRASQNRERNEWKNRTRAEGMGFNTWGAAGRAAVESHLRTIQITGLSRGGTLGQLVYALDTGSVGGLFTYDVASDAEIRLFHRQEFLARDLARHPHEELIALSLPEPDQTAHLATIEPGGRGMRRLSDGDVLDQSPSWVPGARALVYQSAGIARNPRGMLVAIGPYAVCKLDLEAEKLTTLLENPRYDYLIPRQTADGQLYCIRRPYQSSHHSFSPVGVLLDVVLFPYRLIRAILAFLNFFSIMFTQKPLTTAGGPNQKVDSRYMMLWGKVIDAEKLINASKGDKSVPLVPKTWELIRIGKDGSAKVLANHVLSFDLSADGQVLYTDGSHITALAADGQSMEVCTHRMVQQVLFVD